MKRFLQRVGLVFAAVSFMVLLCEVLVRALQPMEVVPDPILGRRAVHRRGWDANGFKNHRVLSQADVVAIGDSQTEGFNVTIDTVWPQLFAEVSSTSVYQMALGSWGPVQYRSSRGPGHRRRT